MVHRSTLRGGKGKIDYESYRCDASEVTFRRPSADEMAALQQLNKENSQATFFMPLLFAIPGVFISIVLFMFSKVLLGVCVLGIMLGLAVFSYMTLKKKAFMAVDFEVADDMEVVSCSYSNEHITECRVWSEAQQKYITGLRVNRQGEKVRPGKKLILVRCILENGEHYTLVTQNKMNMLLFTARGRTR
ncbi:MAG: hypothetical protein J5786_01070 [Clostridiales bacterium]|nr:hypothetical protein [Clostridiales bacterium]